MKTTGSRELVDGPNGELFLVRGEADGTYSLNVVDLSEVGRFPRKWQAVRAAHGEESS